MCLHKLLVKIKYLRDVGYFLKLVLESSTRQMFTSQKS